MKKSSLYVDNIHLLKKMDIAYQDAFDKFYKVLLKENKDEYTKTMIANVAIEQLNHANMKKQDPHIVISSDRQYRSYLKNIEKSKDFSHMKEVIKKQDYEKITISGIWLVFSVSLVLMFFKSLLTQKYFINLNIDFIFAIIAFVLAFQNYRVRNRIIQRYHLQNIFYLYDIVSLICCIVSKIIVPGHFDVSYLILVINYFITKKKMKKVLEK